MTAGNVDAGFRVEDGYRDAGDGDWYQPGKLIAMTDNDLTNIDGVGPAIAEQLRDAGFETVADVQDASVEELADVHLLDEATARAILNEEGGSSKGRDFMIDESDHEDILTAARQGKSERGCARAAGVSSWAQLNRYLEAHPDFRSSFERARAHERARSRS